MAIIKADADEIRNLKTEILNQCDTLETSLQSMYESVTELNETWAGPNHDKFVADFEGRHANMKDFNRIIKNFASNIGGAAYRYEMCEYNVQKLC